MRIATLAALLLATLILGGTCLPLVDNTSRTLDSLDGATKLAIAVQRPTAAETVAQGDTVTIGWTGSNLTGQVATISIVAESREAGLPSTTLASGLPFSGTGDSGTYAWDTAGFSGPYAVTVELITPSQTASAEVDGLITVDGPPTFEFLSPTADVTYDPNDPLVIRWRGADNDGSARIGLDVDEDHANGDEVFIYDANLPTELDEEEFEWNGRDVDGQAVAPAPYNLFALVTDAVNDDQFVDAGARITVQEEDQSPTQTAITDPNDDVEFLDADGSLTIKYVVVASDDALVDILVDTDDNHSNGNEITILSRELVESGDDPNAFEWDGKDADGAEVPDGIYRPVLAVSTGSGNPSLTQGPGLIFRRATEDQPLIELLAPNQDVDVNIGSYVNISWRDDTGAGDDDPNDTATIRLVIDEDGDPTTVGDQVEILSGVDAAGDGVQDTFSWKVLASQVTRGTRYSVIGFIERGAETHTSIAGGTVKVIDPDAT